MLGNGTKCHDSQPKPWQDRGFHQVGERIGVRFDSGEGRMEVLHNGNLLGTVFNGMKGDMRPAVSCLGRHRFALIFNSNAKVGHKFDNNSLRNLTLKSKFERFQMGPKFWLFGDANRKFSRSVKIRNLQLMDVYLTAKEAGAMQAAGSRLLSTEHLYQMTHSLRSMDFPIHWTVRALVAAKGDQRLASDWLQLQQSRLVELDAFDRRKKLVTHEMFRGFEYKYVIVALNKTHGSMAGALHWLRTSARSAEFKKKVKKKAADEKKSGDEDLILAEDIKLDEDALGADDSKDDEDDDSGLAEQGAFKCGDVFVVGGGTGYCTAVDPNNQNNNYFNPTVPTPQSIGTGTNDPVVKVSGSMYTMIALTESGKVYTWGSNTLGQCGIKPYVSKIRTPTINDTLQNFRAIDVGVSGSNGAAIIEEGDVYAWGSKNKGLCAMAGSGAQYKPVKIPFPEPCRLMALGEQHLIAASDCKVWGLGDNSYGQLGIGNTSSRVTTPLQMVWKEDFGKIQALTAGQYCVGVLAADGKVYTCGGSGSQMGRGKSTSDKYLTVIPNLPPIRTLKFKRAYCYAIDLDGQMWAWGSGYLGTTSSFGSTQTVSTPAPVANLKGKHVVDVSMYSHTAALLDNGEVWIWGSGSNCMGAARSSYNPKLSNHNAQKKKLFAVACGYQTTWLLEHKKGSARVGYLVRRRKAKAESGEDETEIVEERATLPPSRTLLCSSANPSCTWCLPKSNPALSSKGIFLASGLI